MVAVPGPLDFHDVEPGLVEQVARKLSSRSWQVGPIGAVAVHGFCGIWGTLSLGLLATGQYGVPTATGADTTTVVKGLFYGGGTGQLRAQFIGSMTAVVVVTSVAQFGTSSAAGNISNAGVIAARKTGIFVAGVSTFTGNISNDGTIAAGSLGIFVDAVRTFDGGISNV